MNNTAPLIDWQDETLSVGNNSMDDTHKEFIELINLLDKADNEQFKSLFNELLEHTQAHFSRENDLMEKSGFPPTPIHQGEHERILDEFMQLQSLIEKNQLDKVHQYIHNYIPDWFSMHAATMDRALAWHLNNCGMGD
jgi:hemerythrin-like metal-binding protein